MLAAGHFQLSLDAGNTVGRQICFSCVLHNFTPTLLAQVRVAEITYLSAIRYVVVVLDAYRNLESRNTSHRDNCAGAQVKSDNIRWSAQGLGVLFFVFLWRCSFKGFQWATRYMIEGMIVRDLGSQCPPQEMNISFTPRNRDLFKNRNCTAFAFFCVWLNTKTIYQYI